MPRVVAKPDRSREVKAWDEAALAAFLDAIVGHRWEVPLRLSALYGLRRSELLGLHWSALDLKKGTVRIEQALSKSTDARSGPRERTRGPGEPSRSTRA